VRQNRVGILGKFSAKVVSKPAAFPCIIILFKGRKILLAKCKYCPKCLTTYNPNRVQYFFV
jgi:hypothetical protein